jgi:hypothetical protein
VIALSVAAGIGVGFVKGATLGIAAGGGLAIGLAIIVAFIQPPPPGKGGDPGAINFGTK